jgi:5-methyltetrahydropteroyltriglutamate--homocysteine methyltransferase
MSGIPPFAVTTVGSWPRPHALLVAQKRARDGTGTEEAFQRLADESVTRIVGMQEQAGADILTDGEQRRDNFVSFVAKRLDGVRLMSLAEMLDIIEDKVAFERILQTLDVPSYAISNATCVGRISRKGALVADDLRFLKTLTSKPVKATLPGPYILTRSMFVKEATRPHYDSKEDLAEDVIAILRAEVSELIEAGADFIQFDEPVLTELVFTQGQTRTFMCAALAARKDPAEELEFAVSLLNRILDGFDGVRFGLHVCRGNWSRDESTLLQGTYEPLHPYFDRMNVDQLVLEYATDRAGDLIGFEGKELGLGAVNPRTDAIEGVDHVVGVIERALEHYDPERLFLNPDCGFGTFANRPMNSDEVAVAKIRTLAEAARRMRERVAAV